MPKSRLDQHLVTHHSLSRARAQALIKQAHVAVNGVAITKASYAVQKQDIVELTTMDHPWVSRGGMKLAHALEHFNISVKGFTAIDVGASTGGFTDVLLNAGASKVYAVDVGNDQLHQKLRKNARVISLENTNARGITQEHIPDPIDIIVCDASFISLKLVLPAALALAKTASPLPLGEGQGEGNHSATPHPNLLSQGEGTSAAHCITLIKPQFEVGKERLGKGGVVKDAALHRQVCNDISVWFEEIGWQVQGVTQSPITGPKGNIEFLLYATRNIS